MSYVECLKEYEPICFDGTPALYYFDLGSEIGNSNDLVRNFPTTEQVRKQFE